MNLYLLTRQDPPDFDEYDSAVVIAPNEKSARAMHPSGEQVDPSAEPHYRGWVKPDKVIVVFLGESISHAQQVVCASQR